MDRTEILHNLVNIVSITTGKEIDSKFINENCDLIHDLGLNSVGMLYSVISIENFFNISFDNIGFDDIKTVKDVVDFIDNKIN